VQFFVLRKKIAFFICTFAKNFARAGGALAIQTRLIALGLHRPCKRKLKNPTRNEIICTYTADIRSELSTL
jgi:hypothetical protein